MRFWLLSLVLVSLIFLLGKEHRFQVEPGRVLYVLDSLEQGPTSLFYVEEIPSEAKSLPLRYWVQFDGPQSAVEFYDNSWFDRLLKPSADLSRTRLLRVVHPFSVWVDPKPFNRLKEKKDLYSYYPGVDTIPKSNMDVPQKANDFGRCEPSQKPPLQKDGEPCKGRGEAVALPEFLWQEIVAVLEEDPQLKRYYDKGLITPPMVAAAAHLETHISPLAENLGEKELCLEGKCTPYKWGKGIGQIGASEAPELWNMYWEAPQDHPQAFVRNFETLSKKLLGNCSGEDGLSQRCIKKFKKHISNCRLFEKLTGGTSHAFCFKPSFRMFATKMLRAFSKDSIVWQQYLKENKPAVKPKPILDIIDSIAAGDKELWFATSARLRAGAINRGAMVHLSLQECVNHPEKISCNYGNLSNRVGRRPASGNKLGTPPRHLGAQILKGEFINRCHVWAFAGLCGKVRKGSLLDQYTESYQTKMGPLPPVNIKAL